jgi:uncharacterized coiled-coil DUF342 family protein
VARDVEADVVINDKSDRGLRSATDKLRGYDRELDKTTKATDKVTQGTGKLGKAASDNARAINKLNDEISKSQRELGLLARSFTEAGDAAQKMDITKSIRKQQAEIRNLTKNRDLIKSFAPEPAEIASIGSKLSAGIGSALAGSSPLVAGLSAAAVAAAPTMGAVISGAIIGGAGLAGVTGGLVVAAQDQRVQAAFKGLTNGVRLDLEKAAIPFINTTIAGIKRIDQALSTIDFDQIFGDSSKFVAPLSDAVGSLIEDLGDGLESLVANAGPAIDSIADGITLIGESLGDGLESLSDNGESAAEALNLLFFTIGAGVNTVFTLVNALTEAYEIADRFHLNGILPFLADLGSDSDEAGASLGEAANGTNDFQRALQETAGAAAQLSPNLQDIAKATQDIVDANRSLFSSEADAAAAIRDANEAIEENGKSLDVNTEKGNANQQALASLAGSLSSYYNKLVEVDGLTPEVAAKGDSLRAAFIKSAEAAGYSASKAEELTNKVLGIPDSHETKIKADNEAALNATREANRAINGVPTAHDTRINGYAANAIAAAQAARNAIAAIPSYKEVQVAIRVTGNTNASAVGSALRKQNLQFAAGLTTVSESSGTQRAGGPDKVTFDVSNNVTIDGVPLVGLMRTTIRESQRRQNWKQGQRELNSRLSRRN